MTVSSISFLNKVSTMVTQNGPRHRCAEYVYTNGGKAVELTKAEFHALYNAKGFADGPYRDTFGDGCREPYNPWRQAFGKLKDGRIVYCELSPQ